MVGEGRREATIALVPGFAARGQRRAAGVGRHPGDNQHSPASQFCHRYGFLPRGGGYSAEEPVADQLLINRARENARPVPPRELQVKAKVTKNGYEMSCLAQAVALYGYDPEGSPRLGFTYALLDREQGLQTFSIGSGFPYEEDPSCWAEMLLVD